MNSTWESKKVLLENQKRSINVEIELNQRFMSLVNVYGLVYYNLLTVIHHSGCLDSKTALGILFCRADIISFFNIYFLFFVVWQSHLLDFFHYSQCHLYWFDIYKMTISLFVATMSRLFKVMQAVSVVIWMELEPISPVWYSLQFKAYH